jgi:hypothetical protein
MTLTKVDGGFWFLFMGGFYARLSVALLGKIALALDLPGWGNSVGNAGRFIPML